MSLIRILNETVFLPFIVFLHISPRSTIIPCADRRAQRYTEMETRVRTELLMLLDVANCSAVAGFAPNMNDSLIQLKLAANHN